jgi:hypothetical protein
MLAASVGSANRASVAADAIERHQQPEPMQLAQKSLVESDSAFARLGAEPLPGERWQLAQCVCVMKKTQRPDHGAILTETESSSVATLLTRGLQ